MPGEGGGGDPGPGEGVGLEDGAARGHLRPRLPRLNWQNPRRACRVPNRASSFPSESSGHKSRSFTRNGWRVKLGLVRIWLERAPRDLLYARVPLLAPSKRIGLPEKAERAV